MTGISDDQASQLDVTALLGRGLGDGSGALRGELQGEGALAAAVQLERDGVPVDDVALALSQARAPALGIELEPLALPPRLAGWLEAGADDELLPEWLGLVANLMMMRAAYR